MAGTPALETVTRDLPALAFRAAVRPDSVDVEKRTVDVVWTTGARVKRGFWEPYWEELSLDPKHVRMERLNNGAPLLAAHNGFDLGAVLGVVESARLEKTKGVATVRFAKAEDSPEAEKVFRMVKDGILQNISVGYRVHRLEKVEEEDDKCPVMRATDWEPMELSIVPMGADDGAGVRGATNQAHNPCVIVTHKENRNMADPNSPTTPAPAAPGADPVEGLVAAAREQNAQHAAETAAASARAAENAAAEERTRIAEINKLVRMTKLGEPFADRLIKSGVKVDKVREIVLQELARADDETAISGHIRFEAGEDARDKFVRGACASIFERSGHTQAIEAAKSNKRIGHLLRDVATDPGEFRGMRLLDLARAALEMRGVAVRGFNGEQLVKRALEFRGDSGFNTTSDFAILLETAVNRIFLGQYALAPVTWPEWCGKKSVQDFRTSTLYRPGSFGVLDTVTEGGEIKHKNIPDGAKAALTPATKGNIIGITRRAIVNDDLGAFRDLASALGTAAAFTIESDAFALLTVNSGLGPTQSDSQPLFHANRSNIGSTGAMSVATLDSIRAKMGLQKDASANMYLNLRPAIWLGPVELEGQAKVFNESAADPTDNKSGQVPNRVRGLFNKVIGSGFLSAQSATRHYGLADPGLYPAFAVGFIDGNESPQIASEQSFGFDGVQMKVVLDYGTAVLDYRAAATCAGA